MWLLQRKTREREYRVEVLKRLGRPLKCPHVEFERGGAQPAHRKRPAERHAHDALAGDGVRGGPLFRPQLENHLCEPRRVQSECKQHEMPERLRVEPETKELHRVQVGRPRHRRHDARAPLPERDRRVHERLEGAHRGWPLGTQELAESLAAHPRAAPEDERSMQRSKDLPRVDELFCSLKHSLITGRHGNSYMITIILCQSRSG